MRPDEEITMEDIFNSINRKQVKEQNFNMIEEDPYRPKSRKYYERMAKKKSKLPELNVTDLEIMQIFEVYFNKLVDMGSTFNYSDGRIESYENLREGIIVNFTREDEANEKTPIKFIFKTFTVDSDCQGEGWHYDSVLSEIYVKKMCEKYGDFYMHIYASNLVSYQRYLYHNGKNLERCVSDLQQRLSFIGKRANFPEMMLFNSSNYDFNELADVVSEENE